MYHRILSLLVLVLFASFARPATAQLSSGCHSGYAYAEGDGHVEVAVYSPGCAHNPTVHDEWTETGTFITAEGKPCHGYTKAWVVFGWVKYTWYSEGCPHKPKPRPKNLTLESDGGEFTLESAPQPLVPFATVASVVSQTAQRSEPWQPCGDNPTSSHCVCVTLTWLCGGEEHAVTYRLCSACDITAVKNIMTQATAFGCTLISRQVVACQ